jgi:hypothetical protein
MTRIVIVILVTSIQIYISFEGFTAVECFILGCDAGRLGGLHRLHYEGEKSESWEQR